MTDIKEAVRRAAQKGKRQAEDVVGGPARLQIILVLAAVFGLDTADKAAIAAVADQLKTAFQIGNTDIGYLIGAVSFVGAVFTLPIGALVDRMSRRTILLAAIALWTVATIVSGFATSFIFLLLARIFLGAVTAAASPTVASLTGDYFPANERAKIYGMILAGELIGVGFGYLMAGEVASWLSWRWPLFALAIPSGALIWAIWKYLPEPARGGQSWIRVGQHRVRSEQDAQSQPQTNAGQSSESEQVTQRAIRDAGIEPREELILHRDPSRQSLWWAIRYVIRIPTYVYLVIASSLAYYFFAGVRAFGMIYLPAHWGISRATFSALVLVIGVGALAGAVLGGRFSERLLRRGFLQTRIVLPGIALFAASLFMGPAIWTTSVIAGVVLLTFGAFALAAANPSIDAARLDIIHPRLWGRAESGRMALRATLEGAAPILFGLVSNWIGGGNAGLEWTFLMMLVLVVIAASLAIPARHTYLRDVATASASIEALSGNKNKQRKNKRPR